MGEKHSHIDSEGRAGITIDSSLTKMQIEAAEEILFEYTSIEPEVPEEIKRRAIRLAFFHWLKHKSYNNSHKPLQSFQRAVQIALKKFEGKRETYNVIMFLNMSQEQSRYLHSTSIRGYEIKFPSWREMSDFDMEELWKEAKLRSRITGHKSPMLIEEQDTRVYSIDYINFSPVLMSINAYDARNAIYIALEQLDLLRGILNLAPANRLWAHYSNFPTPMCKLWPSPVYVAFNQAGVLVDKAFLNESYMYRKELFDEKDLQSAIALIEEIDRAQGQSLILLFIRLLRLYQDALDQTNPRARFLALWQVLELSVKDKPERGTNIGARVAILLKITNQELLREALNLLARHRNELVHSGLFSVEPDELVLLLKKFVDYALYAILELATTLSDDRELEEYLSYSGINNADLTRKNRVIEVILSTRK